MTAKNSCGFFKAVAKQILPLVHRGIFFSYAPKKLKQILDKRKMKMKQKWRLLTKIFIKPESIQDEKPF